MTGSAPEPDECPGVQLISLEIDPANSLVVVLNGELGCPTCGRSGDRWVVPTWQGRMLHQRPDARPDPGE